MRLITVMQCIEARALLGWSRKELADNARVAVRAVAAFEEGAGSPSSATLMAMAHAFDAEGVKFSGARGVGFPSAGFDTKDRPDPRRLGLEHEIETA